MGQGFSNEMLCMLLSVPLVLSEVDHSVNHGAGIACW